MPDVSQLGIVVTLKDGQAVAQQLDAIGSTGEKAQQRVEVATGKVTQAVKAQAAAIAEAQRYYDLGQASLADEQLLRREGLLNRQTTDWYAVADAERVATEATVARMTAEQGGLYASQAMIAKQAEAIDMNERMGQGFTTTGAGLGRLRQGLVSLTAQLTGTNPILDRTAATLGSMVSGSAIILGVVAGIAAVSAVYHRVTEDSRTAREEMDKLTKSLVAEADAADKASRSGILLSIQKEQVEVQHLTAEYRKLVDLEAELNSPESAGAGGGVVSSRASSVFKDLTTSVRALEQGYRNLSAFDSEDAKRQEREARAAASAKAMIDARRDELDKQLALNKAYGDSAFALKLLEIRYDAAIQKSKDAKDHHGAELDALNSLTDAIAKQKEVAALNAAVTDDQNKSVETLTNSLKGLTPQWTLNAAVFHDIDTAQKAFNEDAKEAGKIAAANIAATKKQNDETANAIKAQEKYVTDMKDIWSTGIDRIVTNGTKSFQNFFNDVLAMFNKMIARMEQAGKGSSIGAQLLGLGSAAIGGGFAGYSIGQATGSSATGFFGGAAAGAAVGSAAGPWGAVIGGLVGAVGGLFGAAAAHKQAAEALQKAAAAFALKESVYIAGAGGNTIASQLAQAQADMEALLAEARDIYKDPTEYYKHASAIGGAEQTREGKIASDFWAGVGHDLNAVSGPAGQLANAMADIKTQYDANIAAAHALNATDAQLAQIEALRTAQEKQLADAVAQQNQRAKEDYQVRLLAATGHGDQADALRLQLAQQREYQDAVKAGLDDATLAALALAQAAESAAAAAKKAQDAQRGIDDLRVRELTAQGQGGAADDLRFQLQQQRELEDAIASNQSQDYIDKLKEVLALEATARQGAAQAANAASAVGTDTYNRTAIGTVSAISDAQANGVLGRLDTGNSYLASIDLTLRNATTSGASLFRGSDAASGGNVIVQIMMPPEEWAAVVGDSPSIQSALDRASGRGLSRARASAGATRR